MRIVNLQTDRIPNPLGFALEAPTLSWTVEDTTDTRQMAARIVVATDPAFRDFVYDSGRQDGGALDSLGVRPAIDLRPRTRYWWRVTIWGETENATSEPAWFETAKRDEPWEAVWITPDLEDRDVHPVFERSFDLPAEPADPSAPAAVPGAARLYACGLGLYELEVNGLRVGDEFLAPGCNAYDRWIQYQTYDLAPYLRPGANRIRAFLGNGWYKGRYSLDATHRGIYGDRFAFLAEIRIPLADGGEIRLGTDRRWTAARSPVLASDIFDGETFDARIAATPPGPEDAIPVAVLDLGKDRLQARRSIPVRITETLPPVAVLRSPSGDPILDFGQNLVGWLRFRTTAPTGTSIVIQHGELLEPDGDLHRANLRSAKAEFRYTAAGTEAQVQPRFTFFGFRYAKVLGWPGALDPADFEACVVRSDMPVIGSIETSNPKVNRLFLNALWGQKGNSVDLPTDCPQRDERMGWTGDTQVFVPTGCLNMDAAAFYGKYAYDVAQEQEKRGGSVPFVVPATDLQGDGSSVWGDVATFLPWDVYEFTGDHAILERQYASMRAWVDYIRSRDEADGGRRLWKTGFHFGDWLALDGSDPSSPMGGTPEDFIASAYYCRSAEIVAKASEVLGHEAERAAYQRLSDEVRAAIRAEYFTPTGRLAVETQTGYALALRFDLVPDRFRSRIAQDFALRLQRDKYHLRTGFTGTPHLCAALSGSGSNALAYRLLLTEDYPSWLYAVNLGATTIWERWNSVAPDGTMSSTGMNSLNHYAYGAIAEWMYRTMCGLNPSCGDGAVGFRHALLAPRPDPSLRHAKATCRTAAGLFESGWQATDRDTYLFTFDVPFGATARVELVDAPRTAGSILLDSTPIEPDFRDGLLVLELRSGRHTVEFAPTTGIRRRFGTRTPIAQLLKNEAARAVLAALSPMFAAADDGFLQHIGDATLVQMASTPYLPLNEAQLDALDATLSRIET